MIENCHSGVAWFCWAMAVCRWMVPGVSKDREAFDPSRRLEILAQHHEVKSQKNGIHRSFASEPNIFIALQSHDLRFY
jgi:hypothetical protein